MLLRRGRSSKSNPTFLPPPLFPQPVTSPFLSPPPLPYFIYAYPQFPFSLPPSPPRPHEKCGLSSLSSSPLFPSPLLRRRQRPIYPGLSGILSLPPSSSSLLVNESIAIVQRRGPRRHHSTSHFSSFLFFVQIPVYGYDDPTKSFSSMGGRISKISPTHPHPFNFLFGFLGQAASMRMRCCD